MKYAQSGVACTQALDFLVNGNPVVPTTGSVYLTVQKNDQTVVGTWNRTALTPSTGATNVSVTISSANNTPTLLYELRYLTLEFGYGGKTYFIRDSYALRSVVNFPLSPSEVKGLLAIGDAELPDEDIDVLRAFDQVKEDLGTDADADTILAAGDLRTPSVIEAVKYRAAITLLDTIELRVFQTEQADNTKYSRFSKIDFQGLRASLSLTYSNFLKVVTEDTEQAAYTLATLSFGTDPVTNT